MQRISPEITVNMFIDTRKQIRNNFFTAGLYVMFVLLYPF